MPTTDIEKSSNSPYFENIDLATGASTKYYANRVVSKQYRSFPDTVKRPKPVDLFAAATSRSTNSAIWNVTSDLVVSETPWPYRTKNRYWIRPERPGSLLQNDVSNLNLSNRLLSTIKDQKVNLSVSIPELGKTTDLVFDLARDMYSAFRSLRRGGPLADLIRDMSDPRYSLSRSLAQRWLQYTYGIVPTLMDIYGLSELIYQKITSGQYIRVSVSEEFRRFWTTNPSPSETLEFKMIGRHRATARYKIDPGALRTLAQSGITNPALTAWEFTPYSFVVDWVIDIGGYLETLDALVGITDLLTYQSYGYTKEVKQTVRNTTPSRVEEQSGKGTGIQRFTYRNQPTSTLKPSYPIYEPHLSTRRMVSAIALLRNLLP